MTAKIISTLPKNDEGCGWIRQLPMRRAQPEISGEQHADWVVIGAGFTGLSAARQLALLHPQARIILLEAERAAEGSSARNSGFLVDSTLNEGHYSATDIEKYRQKYEIKRAGVLAVQRLVNDLEINCDLEAKGKLHCTAVKAHEKKILNFSKLLTNMELRHTILEGESTVNVVKMINERLVGNTCSGIIMCGWPTPDNKPLLSIETPETQIQYQISRPLGIAIALAKALSEIGTPNAPLIIVGSTFSKAGRHAWQHPLYSLGKTLVPTLVQILGVELGTKSKKVIGVEFDVLDGGMSEGISELAKQLNRDRSPFGRIGTTDDAAENVIWLLSNTSFLVNGSTITLNGGALP